MKTEAKIDIHNANLKKWIKNINQSDIPLKNKKSIEKFLDDASIGKHNPKLKRRNKKCGKRRLCKMAYCLKNLALWLKKDFDKLTSNDITKIVKEIENRDYEDTTKADYKIILIQFLRWLYQKTPRKFHEFTDWITIDVKKKEIPFLQESKIEKMLRSCNTVKQKFLVAFLFDSGCRIEEFLNIRIGDLTEVKDNLSYYKVTIRGEWSKSAGRTIGLFWQHTTQMIKDWLEIHPNKSCLSSPLYPSSYDGVRVLLYKIGKRSLDRKINPHLLRHSSATYYASKLNRYQLCKRYGWTFSSKMPDVYIARAGIEEEKIAENFKQERMKDMMLEIEKLKENNRILMESDKFFAKKLMSLLSVFEKKPGLAKQFLSSVPDEYKKELFG
jgi:integrase